MRHRGIADVLTNDRHVEQEGFGAYGMNGGELPVGHGGPLRLRVPASSATRA